MTEFSIQLLVFSGSLAILISSCLGVFMMIPHLTNERSKKIAKQINFKHLLAAHLDWIMLGLMQGLAAGLIAAFSLEVGLWVIILMIYGAWMNPVPYFLRAFGINAFVFAGAPIAKFFNILATISVICIITSWSVLLYAAASAF